MNIFAGMPMALTVVIIFLLVRAMAGMVAAFARPAGFILAFAAGMIVSSFQGMTAVLSFPLVQVAFDLSAGLLLFNFACITLRTAPSGTSPSWSMADSSRRLMVLALPVVALLVPVLGSRIVPGTFVLGPLRLGLLLGIALWLSRQGRPLDLLAATGAWLLMDSGFFFDTGTLSAIVLSGSGPSAGVLPYLLLMASAGLIVTMSRVEVAKQGTTAWNLTRDSLIALSAMLVVSLRLLGVNWGPAALIAGILAGFAGRNKHQKNTPALAEIVALEAGLVCSFAIGLGMGLVDSRVHPGETAIILVAALAVPALRGLLSTGTGRIGERMASLLPASAAPFAILLFAGPLEGSGLRSMGFGLIIASLVAIPSARFTSGDTTNPHHGGRRWKPLVAVSRRGNAAGILTFAHALADPDQPIRSVCVAATPGSQGPDAAEAEETLVRAVAAGASNGYRILPSMVTAASTADGLARAALERRSDCIVIGWNENPTPSDPDSRSIIDALVHATPANVISVRKPEIFSQAKRLIFVTMAGSMTEDDYREAAAIARAAWGRRPSGLEAVVIGGATDELASALGLDPRQIAAIPVWRDLPDTIRNGGSQLPAFFVAAARPDWPGWNPGTERIPLVLEDTFPDAALAVFYLKTPSATDDGTEDEAEASTNPVSMGASSASSSSSSSSSSGSGKKESLMSSGKYAERKTTEGAPSWPPIIQVAIQSGRIMTTMKEAVLVDALSTLTKVLFPSDRTVASRMASDFSTVARTEPIELAPGILLLHAHANGIAVPALAIGVNKDGWRLVALDEPVRIVIMLVSPVEAGPAAHLEALTQIAKAIRDHGFALAILDPARGTEFSQT